MAEAASGRPDKAPLSVANNPPSPPDDKVLLALLDVTKAELDTEFKITERFDAKAAAFFGFAVLIFGAANAFILRSNFHTLRPGHRHTLEALVIAAGAAFFVALIAVMKATLQRRERNIKDVDLYKMSRDPNTDLQGVVQFYIALLSARREGNKKRQFWTRLAEFFSLLATVAVVVEFVFALVYFL